jgi:hypothetical protein
MYIFSRIKLLYKYLFSFLKTDWDLTDYPVRYTYQRTKDSVNIKATDATTWCAQIINWWVVSSLGNTKKEAYNELLKNFKTHKANHKLPRPGIKVPIEFAPSTKIDCFDHIAINFFKEILDLDYYNCFISDGSSLWDFEDSDSIEPFYEKIKIIYGIDVSDIDDGNLVEIFKRIELLSNNY